MPTSHSILRWGSRWRRIDQITSAMTTTMEQDAGERDGGKHQAGLTRTAASLRFQTSGRSSQPMPGPGGFSK